MDDIETPYRTQSTERHFQVIDETGRVALDCGNEANAEHYVTLLNHAFQRGFKAGYRAAKRGTT